ncbi:MAG TPA: hypothetical protein PKM59_01975 [Thermodesulfobacteriota bacterium]|nr:hypothetical protein [Thermodesulfobacteriota bacterium]HNU70581.1 hypothetical protein [Thermodesulfobacteriota bacterium]
MPYQLKPGVESFQVVDGPMAYTTFQKGKAYDQIPPEQADKFQEVGNSAAPSKSSARRGAGAQGKGDNEVGTGTDMTGGE